ncbi:envelope glycoprotein O [Elephant endotheliotropic herpesvirus 6]|nr:envelope glycoprotein O [Elephant endotheliotropic herpesvirus 6]UEH20626.1 envelope glycoprotein O [Elephant endotheliotropic herpesvirus 6]
MAVSEAVTWQNLQYMMNTTQLTYFTLSHKFDADSVCKDGDRFSLIQCYLRILTLSIAAFQEKRFDCKDITVQNIYNLTMSGFNVLTPIKSCYNKVGNDRNCTLLLTMNDLTHWTYRQALLSGPLKNCTKPWKHIAFLSEKITNMNLTRTPAIMNDTMEFINTYVPTNITMENFLLTTIYSLAQSLGPRCHVDGIFSLSQYANERLTDKKKSK